MNFHEICGAYVGAGLPRPSPIYRPPATYPHVRMKKLNFIIEGHMLSTAVPQTGIEGTLQSRKAKGKNHANI